MAIRTIRREGDEILLKKCKPVKEITPAIIQLLDDMGDTLRSVDGIGLAAPQVGSLKRIVIVNDNNILQEFINPTITETEGEQLCNEACLSVPGICGDITRPQTVTVQAMNRDWEEVTITAAGYLASVFSHELDHLDGVLYITNATDLRRITAADIEARKALRRQ